jgi:hypothetical protein
MECIFFYSDRSDTNAHNCTMFHVLKFRSENEEVKILGSEIEFSWRLLALFKERQNPIIRY